jgi:hypothetical protein
MYRTLTEESKPSLWIQYEYEVLAIYLQFCKPLGRVMKYHAMKQDDYEYAGTGDKAPYVLVYDRPATTLWE